MNLTDIEVIVYFLTVVLSLTFGVVILTLRRNAIILREKKWAMPFAITFFTLAGIYALLLLDLTINPRPPAVSSWPKLSFAINMVMNLGSGVTNYLLFLSAFRLAEPILDKGRLGAFKNSTFGGIFKWPVLLGLLCAAGLLMSFEVRWGAWVKAPDAIFSAIALFLMGYALYQSISYRHDELMAKMAAVASYSYAVLYLFYGLTITKRLVSFSTDDNIDAALIAGLITSVVSLVLKFFLFLPAYSLMLLVSGPLKGVDRLLKDVTQNNKEYLESESVVKAICDELHVNSVRLYIKRPGPNDERVVLCAYPSLPSINGNNKEPMEIKYEKDSHYDRVLKTGEPFIKAPQQKFIRRISEVAVPVFFHKSVIAVLYVERGERNFTEADLINLKRIATMVSPAVQAYRDIDALHKAGKELSKLQIKVKEYDMQRDVINITERMHDAISPVATGVSIEMGFSEYLGVYSPDEDLKKLVEGRLGGALAEEDETDEKGNRWFTVGLKIPGGKDKEKKGGGRVFGKFIFVPESKKLQNIRITVGTNPTFRRVLSALLTETLLNFIRGHLNRLTDKLGSRLSGLKGTEIEGWHRVVEKTATEAKLLWVVAREPEKGKLLGGEEAKQLVEWLDKPEQEEQWELKAENLWLYPLEEPRLETCRVVKKRLRQSGAILWFGVGRKEFGPELKYISPWRYFLEHFCEIADSALGRLQMMKREEKQSKNLLLLYSTIGGTDDNKVTLHDLASHAQSLMLPLESLLEAARNDGLHLNAALRTNIYDLDKARFMIHQEITRLKDIARRNTNPTCSLNQVIRDLSGELENELEQHDITLSIDVPPEALINVPYGVARRALKNILVNAIEALQDYITAERKEIRIHVEPTPAGKFNCDIIDNGPGVPEDVLPTLLVAESVSSKAGGNGVGLHFSKIALLGWGSDISYHGQPGQPGASFRIEFPRAGTSSNGSSR